MKKFFFVLSALFILVGCGSDSTPGEDNSDGGETPTVDESTTVVFRNLDLQTDENKFHLVGDVKAASQAFYYKIEQGEEVIQKEEKYEVEEGDEWVTFEIDGKIPMENVEGEETPILMMYGKSEAGDILHPNYLPIDIQD